MKFSIKLRLFGENILFSVFKRSVDTTLIILCLVVNFIYCIKVLTFWTFSKLPKKIGRIMGIAQKGGGGSTLAQMF